MSGDVAELLGAFLSGAASIIGAGFAIKATVKHMEAECEKRMAAFREGLKEGEQK